jgi:hypothetical protein
LQCIAAIQESYFTHVDEYLGEIVERAQSTGIRVEENLEYQKLDLSDVTESLRAEWSIVCYDFTPRKASEKDTL